MKAELNIRLTFEQVYNIVKQLPKREKIRLSKALEKDVIDSKLSSLLNTFNTDELTDDLITSEVESVRQTMYESKKK
ncbi:MAG TPA: hypothetical protein VEC12_08040 [Bacteroidia bacterium]|nr:hypothetical protein [Bacteroidia bacterium]